MRELPGYRHSPKQSAPIDEEAMERFRKRLEATWDRDNTPRHTFMVFFRSGFDGFCEVASCAKTFAVEVRTCSYDGPRVRSTMTVTCTVDQLDRLKLAVKGCGVTDTAVRALTDEVAEGGREGGDDGVE